MAYGPRLDQISFLIADDCAPTRQLVRAILRGFGITMVREAESGDEAMQAIQARLPDVLITDWAMEPMTGLQLTKLIRTHQDSPNPFMPIIMMTGYSARDRVFRARDAGVTEFLVKPVSPRGLFSRIQAIVEKPRPFIRVGAYFGPDRRRRKEHWDGEERRGRDGSTWAKLPRLGPMTQNEINKLFNP